MTAAKVADQYEVAIERLRALACKSGRSWSVACMVSECRVPIVGFRNADAALRGALGHLMWHVHGKPTCRDCGAWLSHRTARRCRKGQCEATS
ncbi:hypothetical protein AB0M54_24525 [Actinoplanes sp. NPDC051470]|uniref:hypothetical protein n=1 Tax=Actinoplanes sp. NPDC051470 TaxID=3157224 RepID=UPI00343A5578